MAVSRERRQHAPPASGMTKETAVMKRARQTARVRPEPLSCLECEHYRQNAFCALEPAELQRLDADKAVQAYGKGDTIFYQGNPATGLYALVSGLVGIRQADEQGNSVLLNLVMPAELFGVSDYFGGPHHTLTAEALTDVTVCYIERATLDGLLSDNGRLQRGFLDSVVGSLNEMKRTYLQFVFSSVRTRLARLLRLLVTEYSRVNERGEMVLSLPLTRHELADVLGTRPETVIRALHALEQEGTLRFNGRSIAVPDLDLLLDACETE